MIDIIIWGMRALVLKTFLYNLLCASLKQLFEIFSILQMCPETCERLA